MRGDTRRVEIKAQGKMVGDVKSPRILILELATAVVVERHGQDTSGRPTSGRRDECAVAHEQAMLHGLTHTKADHAAARVLAPFANDGIINAT